MSLILDGTSAGGSIASFLTIDDTNDRIGIGTASPLSGLHISDGTNAGSPQNASRKATLMIDAGATASADLQFMVRNGYNSHIFFGDAADSNVGMLWYNHTENSMNFMTNTATAMTIDSSSSVGVGITPSAWGGDQVPIQVGASAFSHYDMDGSGSTFLSNNYFFDGANKAIFYGYTSDYYQSSANHIWRSSGITSAGATASLTERMRINPSGNVGIGTDNPGYKLQVNGSVDILNVKGSTGNAFVRFTDSDATADFSIGADDGSGAGAGAFILYDRSNSAYRLAVNSSGNVGIGITNPADKMHIYNSSGSTMFRADVNANSTVGLEINKTGSTTQSWKIADGVTHNGALQFYDSTDSAVRMHIDGAGNIGINTTAPGSRKMRIVGSSSAYPLALDSTNTDYQLEFQKNGVSEWWIVASASSFKIHENGVGDKLTVLAGGNVGIGTNNPESPLEVSNGTERYRVAFGTGEVYLMARNASAYIEAEYIAESHEFRGFGNDSGNLAWKINSSGHLIPGANDARNIGVNGTAVSNMYMAGGIHFTNGGHGNAHAVHSGGSNYLDAYERGTFTFTLIGDSNPVTTNIAAANTTLYGTGYYEKIGNLCYVSCAYDLTNYNNYIFYHFGNIPFTSYNNSNMYYDMSCGHLRGILFGYGSSTRTDFTFNASVPSNSTQIDLRTTDTTTPFSGYFRVHNINGGKYIRASGVYATA